MSKEEAKKIFVEKARKVHGDKYDYSKIVYTGWKNKTTVVCRKHGEFSLYPQEHLKGVGCPVCKKTEKFINKAREIHGDKYWYGNVVYRTPGEKVEIGCPKHGVFSQTTYSHLVGTGCPKCGRELAIKHRASTTEEFIEKARGIHGDKYDYSQVEYVNNRVKISIICKEHGVFKQRPIAHLRGAGCQKCAKWCGEKKTTEQFINDAKKIHGDKYDYSKVDYVSHKKKVCIICPEHGEFWQTPSNHLSSGGCRRCGYVSMIQNRHDGRAYNREIFIEKARKVHGDRYDYSKVVYKNIYTYVRIVCPVHGEFLQKPYIHLGGSGCLACKTKDKHYQIAKQYTKLQDYKMERRPLYDYDVKHGYIDDYTWMDKTVIDNWGLNDETSKEHTIYAYEFPETKHVYVGLTKNKERRHKEHTRPSYYTHTKKRRRNPVYDYYEKTGIEPVLKYYEENLTRADARKYETLRSEWYENNGWCLLNVAPCGSLGGHKYFKEVTPEEIIEEAHKYNTPKELRKANPFFEKKMWELGISRECFPNIKHQKKCENRKRPSEIRRYTPELLKELCGRYTTFQEVRKNDMALCMYIRNHNLVYEYFPDYKCGERIKKDTKTRIKTKIKKSKIFVKYAHYSNLTKEEFIDKLKTKYENRANLRWKNKKLFKWMKENRNEWLEECFPTKQTIPYENRTKSDFETVCRKYRNRSELRNKNEKLYLFLRDNRKSWFDEFFPPKKI